jgi:hypothetical protein
MQQITTQINARVDNPRFVKDYKLFSLAERIIDCPGMDYVSLVCPDCNRVVKLGCAKLSCLSPYCLDEECVKNRLRLSMLYFNLLKVKSKKLLHIVFGFPKCKVFSRDLRNKHSKMFSLLKKEMKKLGTPLKMIVVRDLNGSENNLYVHYHTAQLPVQDWRKFRQNLYICREKILKKNNIEFSIKFKHYRKTWSLFKYFSYRVAGLFQNSDKEKFGYQRLMDIKEYFSCFYKSRKVKLIGMKPSPKASILALTLNNFIKVCPFCGKTHLELRPNSMINQEYPPPDCDFKISEGNLRKIVEANSKNGF